MSKSAKSIVLYALTIFLSAFLLFQVQPLIGKHILPWFGGTPAVWTTCLLFFQVLLLGGYAYAHWLAGFKNRSVQGMIHSGLLMITLFLLPIIPVETWKPEGSENPLLLILGLLTVTVGGPYFMLTTTGPLLQAWFSVTHKEKSPYPLYALSNAGSLLGLLTYPFFFEPLLSRHTQGIVWSLSYGLFIFLCALCARQISKMSAFALAAPENENLFHEKKDEKAAVKEDASPNVKSATGWLVLSTIGSVFLLSTTNQVTQNVAVIPFLWVLFLSIYLLTFILAFDGNDIYKRWWAIPLLLILSVLTAKDLAGETDFSIKWQVVLYAGTLFTGCMACHGEMARKKPPPRHLTFFFLMVASGGALGGLWVAIAAPLIFPAFWEYHLILIITVAAMTILLWSDYDSPSNKSFPGSRALVVPLIVTLLIMGASLKKALWRDLEDAAALSRNFYGVLKVVEFRDDNMGSVRQMIHGHVLHGTAYENPPWRGKPTSYYGKGTGIWLAASEHPRRLQKKPLKLGVIGLGAGTMAALADKGDTLNFYEINEDVISFSREWFWYQKDSKATINVIPGDARITLERELEDGTGQRYDILAADAFSGDTIPLHLLTLQSARLYKKHLKEDGILAIHISNNHFDLTPVVRGMAEAIGWKAVILDTHDRLEDATWAATWVLITANRSFLESEAVKKAGKYLARQKEKSLQWTDDYTSLFHVLKF